MKVQKEKMQRENETECTYCGAPIWQGDTVYYRVHTSEAFCSRECEKRMRQWDFPEASNA